MGRPSLLSNETPAKLPAIATTGAAAAAAATAAATTAVSAAAATATGTVFARTGFVNPQRAAMEFFAVELGDRLLSFRVRPHLHERESAGLARDTIHDQIAARHGSGLAEEFLEIVLHRLEGQIAYIQFRTHLLTSLHDRTSQYLSPVIPDF
jgi:hypothetical protein